MWWIMAVRFLRSRIEADHVQLHPNLNTGGAGGFTRGMLGKPGAQRKAYQCSSYGG